MRSIGWHHFQWLLASVLVSATTAFVSSDLALLRCRHDLVAASVRRHMVEEQDNAEFGIRVGVEIPLLDVLESEEYRDQYVQPLPSAHLPDEMTTLHVYGMQVIVPVHQSVLEYAVEHAVTYNGGMERQFGHVAWKPTASTSSSSSDADDTTCSTLVGAIGCAAQVLVPPGLLQITEDDDPSPEAAAAAAQLFERGKAQIMLCRGSFRFVVREIKQTFPFPVAIVDELPDDDDSVDSSTVLSTTSQEKSSKEGASDDEDDDDDAIYADLTESQLIRRTLQALQSFVQQQVDATSNEMSLLEQSIVEQSGLPSQAAQRQATEEMAAVWEIFQQYLVDDCDVADRAFSIGFLAAEMANLSNDVRRQILQTTQSNQRLRMVLRELESSVSLTQARKVAQTVTQQAAPEDLDPKELQVGQPSMPPWASNIRKGMRLEYYWNEEWEWCSGTVIEDPVFVVDEYLITFEFEDGEVHKLPFQADEKARWRPARNSFE